MEALNKGNSFSVINSHRSALNLLFSPPSRDEKIINRFLKGVSNLRPPKPKYNFTWNPDPVLTYLEAWYPLHSLTLKDLTFKLVTLMALTSASRVQTLSLVKLDNINITSEKIEIKIEDRVKTTAVGRNQPLLIFPYFRDRPQLCVAHTIETYMKITEPYHSNGEQNLILTIKKPIHAASSQTISHWIKSTLTSAGVDTSVFSAHSVRHASTSAAFRAGVSIEQIRNTAGWTPSSTTFFNFYNKPLKEPNDKLARALIESKKTS